MSGNVYLRADGDPSMSARFYKDPNLPMATLAHSVAAAGVKHVKGDLVYDASAFDDQQIPDGWKTKYLGAAYAARVSALSLNENLVWVVVQPAGKAAAVTLEPATTAIPVREQRAARRRTRRPHHRAARGGRRHRRQRLDRLARAARCATRSSSTIPALFTAGALRAALQKAGITVDGTVKAGKTPANAEKVASLQQIPN